MIKYLTSKSVSKRGLIGIICCIILFLFGYFFVLNYVSTMEDPPLGNTIYIVIGSTLSIISILGFLLILRYLLNQKRRKERKDRRRRSHKLVYLKDAKKTNNSK